MSLSIKRTNLSRLLICLSLAAIVARFYYRHQGDRDTGDLYTILGFSLMFNSFFFISPRGKKR